MLPFVIAYHLIWTTYGSWLPNDPRGSTSRKVKNLKISALGERHFGRKRVQPTVGDVRKFYEKAGLVLQHPFLEIRGAAVGIAAAALSEVVARERYTCYACAIMPDHIHLLMRKHKQRIEEMTENLQNGARRRMIAGSEWPSNHPVWAGGGGWSVFLDHPDDIERTIRYIESNPPRSGMSKQSWDFVIPYDRWPLHEGHNPNSPYARRLRAVGRYPG